MTETIYPITKPIWGFETADWDFQELQSQDWDDEPWAVNLMVMRKDSPYDSYFFDESLGIDYFTIEALDKTVLNVAFNQAILRPTNLDTTLLDSELTSFDGTLWEFLAPYLRQN
ncbi:MAG TPA: hypothetical protein V6D12_21510 [Candidatus Obscuribacterales bacterium]